MNARLPLSSARSAEDLVLFARRVATFDDVGIRLQASGGVLAMTSAVLAPATILDITPTVLGMRTAATDPELVCDLVVAATELTRVEGSDVVLPETSRTAAWAGISPPRSGWIRHGMVRDGPLRTVAREGIARIAEEVQAGLGEEIVRRLRQGVWSTPAAPLHGLVSGAAFAAVALGFLPEREVVSPALHAAGEEVPLYVSGAWTRLGLPAGHVLVRQRLGADQIAAISDTA